MADASAFLCPHGQNKTACLTCYHQRNQQAQQQRQQAAAKPHGPSALPPGVMFTPKAPPPASFDNSKLWEPPMHPDISKLQRPAR